MGATRGLSVVHRSLASQAPTRRFFTGKWAERIDAAGDSLLKHRFMPRPSSVLSVALLLSTTFGLVACKTIYTDMYRPKRNYFKPVKETPKPADVLPAPKPVDALTPLPGAPAPAAPGLDPLAPAPGAPAAPAPAVPAIPGL